ncbi:autophagy-related protein C terminal domain containing protein [Nitzschia inconspicua]|uniref:Autophagy-related protein 2 n=1 Tax=Nitzschia inconspicua TaxID=303405 RepID=A0A9K3LMX3_9STRA|nr:autophagy-related protein C terminal domain containing protein [Nitzschia inconspicua]
MIQWKQRLYAFLLRRVLGPLLDSSAAQKLHDSLDVSLQEGVFVFKDVVLDSDYLTDRLTDKVPGLSIRKASIDRLEIHLTLRENHPSHDATAPTGSNSATTTTQSSLAWRAMKLGTMNESLPAVSLIADVTIDGISLELVPIGRGRRKTPKSAAEQCMNKNKSSPTNTATAIEEHSTKSVIGSYIDAALASLELNLKLINVNVKLCHTPNNNDDDDSMTKEHWLMLKVSVLSYKSLDVRSPAAGSNSTNVSSATESSYKMVVQKLLEFSEVTIITGEVTGPSMLSHGPPQLPSTSTIALAQGNGQIFYRVIEYHQNSTSSIRKDGNPQLQQDIEVKLNQQLNISVDVLSLGRLQTLIQGYRDISEADNDVQCVDSATIAAENSMRKNLHILDNTFEAETDRDDLKALTGIMRQYREAYHLAEHNQLRGGILVPSNAFLDDAYQLEEEHEDSTTFDVFFDANDQSFYNATSVLARSMRRPPEDSENYEEEACEHISTKLRFHLLSGCLKVLFLPSGQPYRPSRPQEYMLWTLEDISVSLSSSYLLSEVTMSVLHFDIEDAQFTTKGIPVEGNDLLESSAVLESPLEIGKVLGFGPESTNSDDSYGDNVLLSNAPCIDLNWTRTKDTETCNITLLCLELCFRSRTVSNLLQLKSLLQDSSLEPLISTVPKTSSLSKDRHNRRAVEMSCICPSLTISIPLLKKVSTESMFLRSREIIPNAIIAESSIGICFDSTSFEVMSQSDQGLEPGQSIFSGEFACHQIFVFAACPEGDKVSFESKMLRKNILAASGRLEVNPFIPISLTVAKVVPNGKENNPGREAFPVVPAITSFKARQEDDDDDDSSDAADQSTNTFLSNFNSRKDLRGADPQISMMADAEKSNVVVTIHIPEILMDVSCKELMTFSQMVDAAKPPVLVVNSPIRPPPTSGLLRSVDVRCVTIICQDVTLSVCEDSTNYSPTSTNFLRCVLAMDEVRFHSLLIGSSMRHFRAISHDPCLYASLGACELPEGTSYRLLDAKARVQVLRNSIRNHSLNPGVPLLFRSRMFTPISNETPSILFDVINSSSSGEKNGIKQKRVHLTLYHITYRYDVESTLIPRLSGLLSDLVTHQHRLESQQTTHVIAEDDSDNPSITRLFISCADVNLDYASPLCFERESRSIVRIGDFRVSSNIMSPGGPIQAYSISMGDLNCHISNSRISCSDEDSRLCRASWFNVPRNDALTEKTAQVFGAMPEAILREIGFVNVISLDVMEAFVTKRQQNVCTGKNRGTNEPQLSTTLTIGTLSVHACKDSFKCFSETVGELQAKLTSLTEDEFSRLKDDAICDVSNFDPRSSEAPSMAVLIQKSAEEQFLIPEVEFSQKEKETHNSFLLDGYEWTTIDHDPLTKLEISPGDEQRSGWYNTDSRAAGSLPVDIIPQHFPLYAIADPLSEGDMHAKRFAGRNAVISVKSRLLIHKLNIRIRFFDGYDWPDSCTEKQREAAMRPGKMFVIEPVPPSVLREEKKNMSKDVSVDGKNSLTRKAELMGKLLDMEEKVSSSFHEALLPQERALKMDREKHLRLNCRQSNVFFQISMNGVTMRVDSFDKSTTHRLQSILELAVSNLFVAETVSMSKPIKMFGEWSSDQEHPRDTRFGTVMLNMATWSPLSKITTATKLESDECDMSIQLLPMRLLLDQRAITFIRAFVNNEDSKDVELVEGKKWSDGLYLIPPPIFKVFKIKPWKVKVDYNPTKMDIAALREGSIVELVNISPIHRMVITLSEVTVVDSLGLGPVFSQVVSSWVKEICGTQLHKFLANARPFEPFTDVGQGLTDLVILPYEAFRQGDSIQRAMRKGLKSLAETVIFQTLTTSSGLTKYAADLMADTLGGGRPNDSSHPLPARPVAVPKGIQDVRRHACESLARGIQTANYKVVVVPYREFTRNGVTGAVSSVIRGIPVLLVAPLTGATEAASYTLLGARNALRPDIRKEEEASMSLH